jgi:hypothetical protein
MQPLLAVLVAQVSSLLLHRGSHWALVFFLALASRPVEREMMSPNIRVAVTVFILFSPCMAGRANRADTPQVHDREKA